MVKVINNNIDLFEAIHTSIENITLEDENVIRVVKAEKIMQFDENTIAKLKDMDFHNGIIEVEAYSRLLPDAPDFSRGFIGIAYRINEMNSEFESFYVRPTNGRKCSDPVRRSHGCQYFSYPGYTFAYFREFGIADYESEVDIDLEEWIKIKAVVEEDRVDFYINDKLILHVDAMKHGSTSRGSVGFFVDIGTEAFYKNLKVTLFD